MNNNFTDKIKQGWYLLTGEDEGEEISDKRRKQLVVLSICVLLAFCLWMVVNLNRQYTINIKVATTLGNVTVNKSLATELPDHVDARVTGSGWDLISLYQDPPSVYLDVSGKEVNLFEQVRRQVSGTSENVTVQKVSPLYLQVKLEEKKSKKVPVKSNIILQTAKQYALLNEPKITPDSVTIRGAKSRIAGIQSWPTDSLKLEDVKEAVSKKISLKQPNALITLSSSSVHYRADIAQFTEGEVTVQVTSRHFPASNIVTFSPSSVQLRYRIPLKEYTDFNHENPFKAYITFQQIQQDTTGFVTPMIEKIPENMHVKITTMQPPDVAYFTIVGN